MRRWQLSSTVILVFGTGFGMMLGLLFSSSLLVGFLGTVLMLAGILLSCRK